MKNFQKKGCFYETFVVLYATNKSGKRQKEEVNMNQLHTPTTTIKTSIQRRSVAVLVMHFYNFDDAPDVS